MYHISFLDPELSAVLNVLLNWLKVFISIQVLKPALFGHKQIISSPSYIVGYYFASLFPPKRSLIPCGVHLAPV